MNVGIHVVKGKHRTICNALRDNLDSGWTAAQIFTHGPRSRQRTKIDIAQVQSLLREYKAVTLYVHSSYPTTIFGNLAKPEVNPRAVIHLVEQADVAIQLNDAPLIVHLPRRKIDLVVDALVACEEAGLDSKATILLEMPAMKSCSDSFETPEKLDKLLRAMEGAKLRSKYGICLDTAHVWAAGVDLTTYETTQKYLTELGKLRYKGKRALQLLHVNGTNINLGGGRDVHIVPGAKADKIWGDIPYEKSGLCAILEYARESKTDIIYEVKEGRTDLNALDILKSRSI